MGHVDFVGGQGIVEETALGIETLEIALAKTDPDGDAEAGPGNQRRGVSGSAGGGAAVQNPLAILFLGIIRHVFRFAFGQTAGSDEFFGEGKFPSTKIRHGRIQHHHIDTHIALPVIVDIPSGSRHLFQAATRGYGIKIIADDNGQWYDRRHGTLE